MRRKRREEDGMSPLLSKLEVKIRERVKHKSTVKENGSSRRNPQGRKAKPRSRSAAGAEGKTAGAEKLISGEGYLGQAQSRSERLRLLHLTPLKRSFVPKLAATSTTRTRKPRYTLTISSKLRHGGNVNSSNNYTIQSIEEEHL